VGDDGDVAQFFDGHGKHSGGACSHHVGYQKD
jgi:hypothetical protein